MTRRWPRWLLAVAACVAMVCLNIYTGEFPRVNITRVAVGQPGRLYDSTVTVNSSAVGQVLYDGPVFVGRTGVIFLAVNITLVTDGEKQSPDWKVGGRANGRTFAARDLIRVPQPGFRLSQDVVFELSPDDLPCFVITFLEQAPIYAHDPQLEIDLGVTPERAAEMLERDRYATLSTTRGEAQVNG